MVASRLGTSWLRRILFGVLCAAFNLATSIGSADAMQFRRVEAGGNDILIRAVGPIVPGDQGRFRALIASLPPTDLVIGMSLDSPGGNVSEAEELAKLVNVLKMKVIVLSGGECSSACFLLFAASPRRFANPDALIGVHSVSREGQETFDAMAATTILARDAAGYGVPDSIIGKMVTTRPNRLSWLTPSDLAALDVIIVPNQVAPPQIATVGPRPSAPDAVPAPRPLNSYNPTGNVPAGSFERGKAARIEWEQWFNGLSGAFKEGAYYWSGERSSKTPGSCNPPAATADWMAGCAAAQRRLAQTDILRKQDREYRDGWNSI